MKRIIAFIIILCMVFSMTACFNDTEVPSSSTESSSNKPNEKPSEESSKEPSEEPSEETSEESSEEESSNEVVKPVVTEYGDFSSAIDKTASSTDRLKQMSLSRLAYNKGNSSYTASQLNSTVSNAQTIVSGGALLGYSNSSKLLKHYLNNSGENYIIDMDEFLSDSKALATRDSSINSALRACEKLAREGEAINVYQKSEVVHHDLTGDWHYAVGSYFSHVEVKNLRVDGSVYSATIVYKVTDFYNWDVTDDNNVFKFVDLSPKDLYQLHCQGMAQEFLSQGEASYTISWVKGSSINTIPQFN